MCHPPKKKQGELSELSNMWVDKLRVLEYVWLFLDQGQKFGAACMHPTVFNKNRSKPTNQNWSKSVGFLKPGLRPVRWVSTKTAD
jgi:hypothetical protein